MHHGHRGVRRSGAGYSGHLAGDHPDQGSGVVGRDEPDVTAAQVLVARVDPLLVAREIDPELDAVEQATGLDQPLRWLLDVQDAAAGGHPLGVAVADRAAATVVVLVVEDAVEDVGDGLEAAVRVPRGALGLTGRVLDLAHLVHVHEGVEQRQVDAGEGAADGEALALEAGRRTRHRRHGARRGPRQSGQGLAVARSGRRRSQQASWLLGWWHRPVHPATTLVEV